MEQYACSPEYVQKDTFESSFPTCGKNRPTKKQLPYNVYTTKNSSNPTVLYIYVCDLYVIHNYIHISYMLHIAYMCYNTVCYMISLSLSFFP